MSINSKTTQNPCETPQKIGKMTTLLTTIALLTLSGCFKEQMDTILTVNPDNDTEKVGKKKPSPQPKEKISVDKTFFVNTYEELKQINKECEKLKGEWLEAELFELDGIEKKISEQLTGVKQIHENVQKMKRFCTDNGISQSEIALLENYVYETLRKNTIQGVKNVERQYYQEKYSLQPHQDDFTGAVNAITGIFPPERIPLSSSNTEPAMTKIDTNPPSKPPASEKMENPQRPNEERYREQIRASFDIRKKIILEKMKKTNLSPEEKREIDSALQEIESAEKELLDKIIPRIIANSRKMDEISSTSTNLRQRNR